MKVNDTLSFFTSVLPGKKITAHISRKSMNVNAQFRSERVEADVLNKDELLDTRHVCGCCDLFKGKVPVFQFPDQPL